MFRVARDFKEKFRSRTTRAVPALRGKVKHDHSLKMHVAFEPHVNADYPVRVKFQGAQPNIVVENGLNVEFYSTPEAAAEKLSALILAYLAEQEAKEKAWEATHAAEVEAAKAAEAEKVAKKKASPFAGDFIGGAGEEESEEEEFGGDGNDE